MSYSSSMLMQVVESDCRKVEKKCACGRSVDYLYMMRIIYNTAQVPTASERLPKQVVNAWEPVCQGRYLIAFTYNM